MRGRWSYILLPIIVLNFLFLTLISAYPHQILSSSNRISEEEIDWTSVERVSRSLTSEEIRQPKRFQIAMVSKEATEDDDYFDDENTQSRESQLAPVMTDLSRDEIIAKGKAAFHALKKANDVPEVVIDQPLKTHQMRLNQWENRHHAKKETPQQAPEWFKRKNDTEVHGCTASPFSQKIHFAGCETKYILNRYCHGACASVYIPELRSKKLKAIFSNCLVCRPAEIEHIQVRLECPGPSIVRNVMRVKACACQEIEAPLPV